MTCSEYTLTYEKIIEKYQQKCSFLVNPTQENIFKKLQESFGNNYFPQNISKFSKNVWFAFSSA